jgi:hypothetical protein
MTKDNNKIPVGFARGTKKIEIIGNKEIGEITIERKGSLTPSEKIDLESLLSKAAISKPFEQKELLEISEKLSKENGKGMMEVFIGLQTQDQEILSKLDNETTKLLVERGFKNVDKRTEESEIENSIYAAVVLRSRIEEFAAIVPENLLNPDHDLFVPYPLLELISEFCYRELHHWKEKKAFEEDDLKSVPR